MYYLNDLADNLCYLSPEILKNISTYSIKSDVWYINDKKEEKNHVLFFLLYLINIISTNKVSRLHSVRDRQTGATFQEQQGREAAYRANNELQFDVYSAAWWR